MGKNIHNRKQRVEAKRRNVIDSAIATIEAVAERRIDAYEGWQRVCGIFQNNAGLGLPELKQFVEIEGVHPNSTLSVTNELRDTIWRNAVQFLAAPIANEFRESCSLSGDGSSLALIATVVRPGRITIR
jgi:hypothetical protein